LGDSSDDDRYSATSVAVATAANTAVTPIAGLANTYAVTADTNTIVGTVALTSGNTTAGKKIAFRLVYVMP
jgi:hypothetical protein